MNAVPCPLARHGPDRRRAGGVLRVHQSLFAAGDAAAAGQEFGASAAEVSHIITVEHAGGRDHRAVHRRDRRRARTKARDRRGDVRAGGADRDGRRWRRRLSQLVFWRSVQGLVLPPIFAVTLAYIGDEWPPARRDRRPGIYSSASSVGGFSGG